MAFFNNFNFNLNADNLGNLFDSSIFNVSSSAVTTGVSGFGFVKAIAKAILSPSIPCKVFYGTAAGLHGVSYVTSSICLAYRYSSVAPIPLGFGTIGCFTSYVGKICNRAGDYMDPTTSAGGSAVETCIDQITKGI